MNYCSEVEYSAGGSEVYCRAAQFRTLNCSAIYCSAVQCIAMAASAYIPLDCLPSALAATLQSEYCITLNITLHFVIHFTTVPYKVNSISLCISLHFNVQYNALHDKLHLIT